MSIKERINAVEIVAKQLHENFRAACKAMGVPKGAYAHDHGWCDCGNRKRAYFRKRAELLIKRSKCADPNTLGEAEQALQALIYLRRAQLDGIAAW